MKNTVTQYISLTVMMLLIAVVVSLLPERAHNLDKATFDNSTSAINSIPVVKSADN